jgi:hypothetical protein
MLYLLTNLPKDIYTKEILLKLDPHSIINFFLSNKYFNNCYNNEQFWLEYLNNYNPEYYRLPYEQYEPPGRIVKELSNKSWKELAIDYYSQYNKSVKLSHDYYYVGYFYKTYKFNISRFDSINDIFNVINNKIGFIPISIKIITYNSGTVIINMHSIFGHPIITYFEKVYLSDLNFYDNKYVFNFISGNEFIGKIDIFPKIDFFADIKEIIV